MAVWLCRSENEVNESKALSEGKIFCTDTFVRKPLSDFHDFHTLVDTVQVCRGCDYETAESYTEELWSFAVDMQLNDLVVMQKDASSPIIHVGMVTSSYDYISFNNPDQQHYRNVNWFTTNLPIASFDDEVKKLLQYERHIARLVDAGKFFGYVFNNLSSKQSETPESYRYKVEREKKSTQAFKKPACMVNLNDHKLLRDVLSEHIFIILDDMVNKDKGRDIIKVFLGVLKAKGFKPSLSPASSPDCLDIMAISNFEKLGGNNLCVQLRLSPNLADMEALHNFQKMMNTFAFNFGLLIAWNGYTKELEDAVDNLGGRVALWTGRDVLRELLKYYDMLDDEYKAILPLQKIWIVHEKFDER